MRCVCLRECHRTMLSVTAEWTSTMRCWTTIHGASTWFTQRTRSPQKHWFNSDWLPLPRNRKWRIGCILFPMDLQRTPSQSASLHWCPSWRRLGLELCFGFIARNFNCKDSLTGWAQEWFNYDLMPWRHQPFHGALTNLFFIHVNVSLCLHQLYSSFASGLFLEIYALRTQQLIAKTTVKSMGSKWCGNLFFLHLNFAVFAFALCVRFRWALCSDTWGAQWSVQHLALQSSDLEPAAAVCWTLLRRVRPLLVQLQVSDTLTNLVRLLPFLFKRNHLSDKSTCQSVPSFQATSIESVCSFQATVGTVTKKRSLLKVERLVFGATGTMMAKMNLQRTWRRRWCRRGLCVHQHSFFLLHNL